MSFPHACLSPDVVPTLCGSPKGRLGVVPTLCVVDRVARVVDRVAGDGGLYPHMWADGIQELRGRRMPLATWMPDIPGHSSGDR